MGNTDHWNLLNSPNSIVAALEQIAEEVALLAVLPVVVLVAHLCINNTHVTR